MAEPVETPKSKFFLYSKAFWGSAIAAIMGLLGLSGADLPFTPETLSDNIVGLLTALAAVWAMYGRTVAKTPLGISTKE